ncbi:MAG: hypothetical protein EBZ48_00485 [Proteobacteria bacterium]|nr:hypothetical protein [Pseudomonadota bacterium]
MDTTLLTAILVSSAAFLSYGVACFFSAHLVREFERYGYAGQRQLIGALEILGAVGQLVGLYVSELLIVSSACLALLMFFAVLVRIKIADPLRQWLPALVLLGVNVLIVIYSMR